MKLTLRDLGFGAGGVIVGVIFAVLALTLSNKTRPAPIVIEPPPPTPMPTPEPTPAPMQVFVTGQVLNPDVYALPAGSIVRDAIELAGGFAPDADLAALNLAQDVSGGMRVYVPAFNEIIPTPFTTESSTVTTDTNAQSVTNVTININTATAGELEGLPGVGPSTAERIVAYREENGLFATIEEIMNVPTIGEGRFEDIRELIRVTD